MLQRLLPYYNNFIVTYGQPLLGIYICNRDQFPQLLPLFFIPSIKDLSTNLLMNREHFIRIISIQLRR